MGWGCGWSRCRRGVKPDVDDGVAGLVAARVEDALWSGEEGVEPGACLGEGAVVQVVFEVGYDPHESAFDLGWSGR